MAREPLMELTRSTMWGPRLLLRPPRLADAPALLDCVDSCRVKIRNTVPWSTQVHTLRQMRKRIRDMFGEHRERSMHGGVPPGKHHHHVMVALFDEKTGNRITDATVTAYVAELGLAGHTKRLEPMPVADTVTYGNYFEMRVSVRYRISVQVRRPASARVVEAEFEYTHHP